MVLDAGQVEVLKSNIFFLFLPYPMMSKTSRSFENIHVGPNDQNFNSASFSHGMVNQEKIYMTDFKTSTWPAAISTFQGKKKQLLKFRVLGQ